jgi:hypothetical protein
MMKSLSGKRFLSELNIIFQNIFAPQVMFRVIWSFIALSARIHCTKLFFGWLKISNISLCSRSYGNIFYSDSFQKIFLRNHPFIEDSSTVSILQCTIIVILVLIFTVTSSFILHLQTVTLSLSLRPLLHTLTLTSSTSSTLYIDFSYNRI